MLSHKKPGQVELFCNIPAQRHQNFKILVPTLQYKYSLLNLHKKTYYNDLNIDYFDDICQELGSHLAMGQCRNKIIFLYLFIHYLLKNKSQK